MLTKNIRLDFGEVSVLDNILIARLDEGILFDLESNRKLLELGREIFNGQDYAYISHRVNSYAVDPMVYIESEKNSALKAIAVVSDNELTRQNAELLEKKFYQDSNRFGIFSTLDEAISWIKAKL